MEFLIIHLRNVPPEKLGYFSVCFPLRSFNVFPVVVDSVGETPFERPQSGGKSVAISIHLQCRGSHRC